MRQRAFNGSQMLEALLTLSLGTSLAYATPGARPAPPQPMVALGTTTMLDAEGGVGAMFQLLGTGYYATRVNDASGDAAPIDFRQNAEVALLHFAYTSNVELFGAYVGGEVLLPVAHVNLRADELQDSTTGVGDAILGVFLQWPKLTLFNRPVSARFDLNIVAPTGAYDRDGAVNLGSAVWQISPYLATTLRVSERWEISNRINYNWSSVSHRPPYATLHDSAQAGDQLAINLSASYAIAGNWRIGIGGYTLQQLSDSKTDGARIRHSRQGVFGFGPSARWNHGQTMLIVSAYKEFEAENRSEGHQGVLRMMRIF